MWGTESWGLIALGGFLAFLANVLYMWGGTSGFSKAWRRFVGASVLATSTNLLAVLTGLWAWPYLLFYPCLMIGFSLGYGGDDIVTKIVRRTIYAIGVLSACLVGAWVTSFSFAGITILTLAVITGLTSIVLGVLNPFNSARLEEYLVCQVLTLYIPYWSFVIRG